VNAGVWMLPVHVCGQYGKPAFYILPVPASGMVNNKTLYGIMPYSVLLFRLYISRLYSREIILISLFWKVKL